MVENFCAGTLKFFELDYGSLSARNPSSCTCRSPERAVRVAAQSIVGSMTFPNYLRAMRRVDLRSDPRFSTAEARLRNYDELHALIQTWMVSFRDLQSLDAQLDESNIAIGQVRSLSELARTEWTHKWGAVEKVSDRQGGAYLRHGYPWKFWEDQLGQRAEPAFRGEHDRQVFAEAGLSDEEIQRAIDQGILVADAAVFAREALAAVASGPAVAHASAPSRKEMSA